MLPKAVCIADTKGSLCWIFSTQSLANHTPVLGRIHWAIQPRKHGRCRGVGEGIFNAFPLLLIQIHVEDPQRSPESLQSGRRSNVSLVDIDSGTLLETAMSPAPPLNEKVRPLAKVLLQCCLDESEAMARASNASHPQRHCLAKSGHRQRSSNCVAFFDKVNETPHVLSQRFGSQPMF